MKNLSDITVFVQVVESGSFTAAAKRLALSKSVVSKYVTRLENQLGAQLINRTTRRLSLTEIGRTFYERSQRGLQELEEANAEVLRLQAAPRGTLKLNTPMSFGISHIAPALPDFLSRYPELSVEMNLDDRKVNLAEEGFDLAVRVADLPDPSLVARRLGPCRYVVCASPQYLQHHGVPHTPDDLIHHNAITFKYQKSPREWRFLSPEGRYISVPVSGSIETNNSLALREALINNAGITSTPTFVVGADIKAGRLKAVLTNYHVQEYSIYIIYLQRRHLSPKVRAFIDFMAERITDMPYWDCI